MAIFTTDLLTGKQLLLTGKFGSTTTGGTSVDYLPLSGGTMDYATLVINMNADLLDGKHGAAYSLTTHNHNGTYLHTSGGTMSNTNKVTNLNADLLDGLHTGAFSLSGHTHSAYITTAGNGLTKSGTNIILGGTLSGDTNINLNTKKLNLNNGGLNVGGTISGGTLKLNTNPTVGVFESGKIYYDSTAKTISAMIDDDITMQIGQEELVLVYNNTGADIPNGKMVYPTGANGDMPTIALAQATEEAKSLILGMTTQLIPNGSSGFVTVRGIVHDVNTSGYTSATILYLSETIPGGITSIEPDPELYYNIKVGVVLEVSPTIGSIYVRPVLNNDFAHLSDVLITSPLVDQIIKYNGTHWINGAQVVVNAGAGVAFFLDKTPIIPDGTQSVGLYTLTKNPTGGTVSDITVPINSTTAVIERFLYDVPLGGIRIDGGIWTFNTYNYVDNAAGTTTMPITVRRVIAGTGSVTTTGTPGTTTRTATVTGGAPFLSSDVNADMRLSGLIRTTTGIFRIIGFTSASVVSIETLSTYTNQSGVAYSKHEFLFNDSNTEINHTTPDLFITQTVQPEFIINPTDKLAVTYYGTSTHNRILHLFHNGTDQYSNFLSPLVTRHNDLPGLQGGAGDERYHMTQAQSVILGNTSGINTGNQDLSSYVPFSGAASNVNLGIRTLTSSTISATTGLVVDKTSGLGIKVDTASPTFGWKDLIGHIQIDAAGLNAATLAPFIGGNVRRWAFSAGDKADLEFHIPHDYVPGSDLFIHYHWSHNGTAISGNIIANMSYTYSDGYGRGIFTAEKTVTSTYDTVNITTTPRYVHRIEEVQLSSAGGSATLLDSALVEVDGVIGINFTMTTTPTITGGSPNEPFIFFIDIHYQSTQMPTKQKNYPFYT